MIHDWASTITGSGEENKFGGEASKANELEYLVKRKAKRYLPYVVSRGGGISSRVILYN